MYYMDTTGAHRDFCDYSCVNFRAGSLLSSVCVSGATPATESSWQLERIMLIKMF